MPPPLLQPLPKLLGNLALLLPLAQKHAPVLKPLWKLTLLPAVAPCKVRLPLPQPLLEVGRSFLFRPQHLLRAARVPSRGLEVVLAFEGLHVSR